MSLLNRRTSLSVRSVSRFFIRLVQNYYDDTSACRWCRLTVCFAEGGGKNCDELSVQLEWFKSSCAGLKLDSSWSSNVDLDRQSVTVLPSIRGVAREGGGGQVPPAEQRMTKFFLPLFLKRPIKKLSIDWRDDAWYKCKLLNFMVR